MKYLILIFLFANTSHATRTRLGTINVPRTTLLSTGVCLDFMKKYCWTRETEYKKHGQCLGYDVVLKEACIVMDGPDHCLYMAKTCNEIKPSSL